MTTSNSGKTSALDKPIDFVHLRVHSAYSLAEGAIKTEELMDLCQRYSMPAVAVTDTNNMFGAMEFSMKSVKSGVQPIIGCQLDIYTDEFDEGQSSQYSQHRRSHAPIVLLAQNELGYKNLSKLVSRSYLDKEQHDPVGLSLNDFEGLSEGLICLTGGPTGPLGQMYKNNQEEAFQACFNKLKSLFPNRLYVELMRHADWDRDLDTLFINLAHEENVPLVATNNCFFPREDFHEAHDALLCIAGGRYITEVERRRETPDHYFKSPREMIDLFSDVPEAIQNTLVISKRCAYALKAVEPVLPAYETGEGRSEAEELRHQCEQGLDWRLEKYVYKDGQTDAQKTAIRKEYFDRMEEELEIISTMQYDGYFLIVADFIQWAKDQDIPVGPGRGSGGGSVVAWAMKIIDINPLEYGLLFERFLNPERVSMPDFDIDFCQSRRDEVIKYVQDKYGRDRVAQIITFGKLQARAVVRDVGRVLQMPYGQVDRISKMIPNNPANPITLQEAIDSDPEFKRLRKEDETVGRLLKIALKLEGLYRHASTHAAGIVIGNQPLENIVPLYKDSRSDMPATQFNLKYVEDASLVKFDFLGLKTLTVLQQALEYIKETEDEEIDLLALDMKDEKTLEMMGEGASTGIFQFEAAFIQDVLKKFQPDKFEDLIALTSLNRPGPMDNIPDYIDIKHERKELIYPHGKLEQLLEETYGIMVYQEQVMEAAKILAGYTLGGADLLRRAMGKKIQEAMDAERVKFVKGCKEVSDIEEDQANEIFDLISKFAGYGFNKSHAAAYSLISYQSAYLKAHYPEEFMAAIMTLDMGNTDKINVYRQDLRRAGIELLPPDVNTSRTSFAVELQDNGTKAIRYALGAIKGAGAAAMELIVQEREENGSYKDLMDFVKRLDPKSLTKRQIEIMAAAGVFDTFGHTRACICEAASYLMGQASKWAEEREVGQSSLFMAGGSEEKSNVWKEDLHLPDRDEWEPLEKLQHEFTAIGFYLSAHPLDNRMDALQANGYKTFPQVIEELTASSKDAMRVKLAGVVIKRQEKRSDRGRWAFVTLSDPGGLYDIMFYTEALMASRDQLVTGNVISIEADATSRGGDIRANARIVQPLDDALVRGIDHIEIEAQNENALKPLSKILKKTERSGHPVGISVTIPLADKGKKISLSLRQKCYLDAEDHKALDKIQNIAVKRR